MKQINIDELKNIQVDILKKFHTYCVDKDINYFISCGTLIGAIRHKGYIPWDDDIDVQLPRKDYEVLIEEFNVSPPEDLRLRSLFSSKDYNLPYAKIENVKTCIIEYADSNVDIGVNIDIFPIDSIPDNKIIRVLYIFIIKMIYSLYMLKVVRISKERCFIKNSVLVIGKSLLYFISARNLARFYDCILLKKNQTTNYVAELVDCTYNKFFTRKAINNYTNIEFEGCFFRTMIGYDEYLNKTYGNYMELPPIDKRVSHHTFKAYWKYS